MRRITYARSERRRVRVGIAWIAVVLVAVAGLVPTSAQTSPAQALPVDYASLLLRPTDAKTVASGGLTVPRAEAYGLDYSQSFTDVDAALQADPYAWSRGAITLPSTRSLDAETMLHTTGWRRLHEQVMAVPDAEVPETFAMAIASGIEEYADADGAAAAYQALSNEDVLAEMALSSRVDPVPGAPHRGDASSMWRIETDRWATDGPADHTLLTMWVLAGHRIAGVTMFDFTPDAVADPRAVDQLMGLLLERLAAAESLPTPGLSLCAPRLDGEPVIPSSDRYEVLDGTVIPLYGETPEARAKRQRNTTDQGIVDRYTVTQQVTGARLAAPGEALLFTGWMIGFEDTRGAEAFQAGTPQRLGAAPGIEQLELEPNPPDIGDSVVEYTFRYEDLAVTTVSVRVEDLVIGLRIEGTRKPVPGVVEALMRAQLERLDHGTCIDSIPVPASLSGIVPPSHVSASTERTR